MKIPHPQSKNKLLEKGGGGEELENRQILGKLKPYYHLKKSTESCKRDNTDS